MPVDQSQERSEEWTIYRWYAEGYRYPVFETVRCATLRGNEVIAYRKRAFHFPPEKHLYLTNDPLNCQLQEAMRDKERAESAKPLISYFNIYPSRVVHSLNIEFFLSGGATVHLRLSNINGTLYQQKSMTLTDGGYYNEQINMESCPSGFYLLNLQIGEKVYLEKVAKQFP